MSLQPSLASAFVPFPVGVLDLVHLEHRQERFAIMDDIEKGVDSINISLEHVD